MHLIGQSRALVPLRELILSGPGAQSGGGGDSGHWTVTPSEAQSGHGQASKWSVKFLWGHKKRIVLDAASHF